MADLKNWNLFGFRIKKKSDETKEIKTFVPPAADDGAVTLSSSAFFGTAAIDVEGVARNEVELITRYREMAMQPELETAIEDIVNEAIVQDKQGKNVKLILDDLKQPDKIKKAIIEEFNTIERLLNYNNLAADIFRRYYVDGRLFYQVIIDINEPKKGILELRYIDPRKIKKVRQIKKRKDDSGVDVIENVEEFYIFNDRVQTAGGGSQQPGGVKIAIDSVINVNSGLLDPKRSMVLSYLHKAIKPLNQLRMIEDASVIYKICLVGDTRIKTNSGWKYIKDITENDVVYSFYGLDGLKETKVKKQWLTAKKQTYKVSSKFFDITGTDNHPILVLDKDTNVVEYVDIKDLAPNKHSFVYGKPEESLDLIQFPEVRNKAIKLLNYELFVDSNIKHKETFIEELSNELKIKKSSVRNFLYGSQYLEKNIAEKVLKSSNLLEHAKTSEKYENTNEDTVYNIPHHIDEEFARLFGFLLGDGTLSNSGITFAEGIDDKQNKFYADILTKYFGNCSRYPINGRKYCNYTTNNILAKELFEQLGFKNGAKIKRIPEWVYNSSDDIKTSLILGIADADGHIIHNELTDSWSARLELSNKQLIEDIKEVWTSLGFASSHIYYRKRASEERIVGEEVCARVMPETESWHIRITNKKLPKFDPILEISEAEVEDVYDVEVESIKHNFIANGIVVHNSRAPQRRVFYIDVGNLPTAKAEQYVRNIMTKYKNKITYDACLDLNTKVPLLDGRTLSIKEISEEYKDKDVWVYSCDPKTGKFAPGLVTWAGMTKRDQKVLKLTLDNGESIICTPDHKFPVWDKGFVEAKDLIVGESMMPYYSREKEVVSGKTSTYQQIFENKSKKWEFTHRLVSEWKDSVGIENEWFFKEEFSDSKKQTIHHKNFNRYDNSPTNLIRMNREDHFKYHHQFNSFAGKIGGSVSGKKQKELGIGMFSMTREQKSELGKWSGSLGGKKSYANKSGIHGLSSEQTLENSKKGNKRLNELLKDPHYNEEFGKKISQGFSEETKKKMIERGKLVDKSRLIMMNKLANESRWGAEKGIENRRKITIEYLESTNSLVDYCAKNNFSAKEAANYISNNINIEEWKTLNKDKSINNRIIESFTSDDLYRICKIKGFNGWKDCKESFVHRNHKITKIEYLEDTMDVGTLTIDGNEIYHNYHTFALSCGIYTKNSTGEIRDSRNHLSILEDFWFPRKSDGRATEVTTLQSTDNFNDMSMVEYFQKALYRSLNVPITRLDPSQAVSIGRSMEITRDELKFSKFIDKIRKKFTDIFYQALRIQLVLKGICTEEEWQQFKEDIYFDFTVDNNFVELKESELYTERLNLLAIVDPFVNKYFSEEWVQKNILRFDDEDIETIAKQMEKGKLKDFDQQVQDTDNQVKLQARAVQLQTQLGLLPEQPIEAGQEAQGSPGQSAPATGKNNPYNV